MKYIITRHYATQNISAPHIYLTSRALDPFYAHLIARNVCTAQT
jgi:hypothetical protein